MHWGHKVTRYSYRRMTKDEDALNAFSGILQLLETDYEDGFFWGLPVTDFQWALLWEAMATPRRREGFPIWSWAGWDAIIWFNYPDNIAKPLEFPVHLQSWKMLRERLVEVFGTGQAAVEDPTDVGSRFCRDPVSIAETCESPSPGFDLSQYPRAEDHGYLFVEAIVLQFIPDYSHPKPKHSMDTYREGEFFIFSIGDTTCLIRTQRSDREMRASMRHGEQQFLLLAREPGGGGNWVFYYLLRVHPRGNLVERGTVIQLIVPKNRLEVLEHLKPQKQRMVLA